MSHRPAEGFDITEWARLIEEANESMLEATERQVETQTALVDQWFDALEDSRPPAEWPADWFVGYTQAYETWIDAMVEQYDLLLEDMEDGEVDLERLRDGWVAAANESFKELMTTDAFAALQGQAIAAALDAQEESQQTAAESLESLGFATRRDVREVGDRLLEIERRLHELESTLEDE